MIISCHSIVPIFSRNRFGNICKQIMQTILRDKRRGVWVCLYLSTSSELYRVCKQIISDTSLCSSVVMFQRKYQWKNYSFRTYSTAAISFTHSSYGKTSISITPSTSKLNLESYLLMQDKMFKNKRTRRVDGIYVIKSLNLKTICCKRKH